MKARGSDSSEVQTYLTANQSKVVHLLYRHKGEGGLTTNDITVGLYPQIDMGADDIRNNLLYPLEENYIVQCYRKFIWIEKGEVKHEFQCVSVWQLTVEFQSFLQRLDDETFEFILRRRHNVD